MMKSFTTSRRNVMKMGAAAAATALPAGAVLQSTSIAAQDQVVINFFHKWPAPEHLDFYNWVIERFQEENPNIRISMDSAGDEPYKDKIRVLLASGDVPDVFFSWTGEFAYQFARDGHVMDLTDAFENSDWKDNVVVSATEPYRFDGRLYGIPMRVNAKFMVYNSAIFDEHGLTEPTTWEEFLSVCQTLKDADVTPIAFGNQFPWASSHYVGDFNAKLVPPDIRRADYTLEAPAEELFTHEGYVEALTRFKLLESESYFNDSPNAINHDLARTSFIAGRTGMIYVELEEFINIAESDIGQEGFGFFPFPSGTGGEGDQELLTGAPDGFMVSATTEHPDEAIAFLKFLTSTESGTEYVNRLGIPSASVDAVSADNALPQVVEGLNVIGDASGMALWLDTDINIQVVETYLPGMQALMDGSTDPQTLMENVRDSAIAAKEALQS